MISRSIVCILVLLHQAMLGEAKDPALTFCPPSTALKNTDVTCRSRTVARRLESPASFRHQRKDSLGVPFTCSSVPLSNDLSTPNSVRNDRLSALANKARSLFFMNRINRKQRYFSRKLATIALALVMAYSITKSDGTIPAAPAAHAASTISSDIGLTDSTALFQSSSVQQHGNANAASMNKNIRFQNQYQITIGHQISSVLFLGAAALGTKMGVEQAPDIAKRIEEEEKSRRKFAAEMIHRDELLKKARQSSGPDNSEDTQDTPKGELKSISESKAKWNDKKIVIDQLKTKVRERNINRQEALNIQRAKHRAVEQQRKQALQKQREEQRKALEEERNELQRTLLQKRQETLDFKLQQVNKFSEEAAARNVTKRRAVSDSVAGEQNKGDDLPYKAPSLRVPTIMDGSISTFRNSSDCNTDDNNNDDKGGPRDGGGISEADKGEVVDNNITMDEDSFTLGPKNVRRDTVNDSANEIVESNASNKIQPEDISSVSPSIDEKVQSSSSNSSTVRADDVELAGKISNQPTTTRTDPPERTGENKIIYRDLLEDRLKLKHQQQNRLTPQAESCVLYRKRKDELLHRNLLKHRYQLELKQKVAAQSQTVGHSSAAEDSGGIEEEQDVKQQDATAIMVQQEPTKNKTVTQSRSSQGFLQTLQAEYANVFTPESPIATDSTSKPHLLYRNQEQRRLSNTSSAIESVTRTEHFRRQRLEERLALLELVTMAATEFLLVSDSYLSILQERRQRKLLQQRLLMEGVERANTKKRDEEEFRRRTLKNRYAFKEKGPMLSRQPSQSGPAVEPTISSKENYGSTLDATKTTDTFEAEDVTKAMQAAMEAASAHEELSQTMKDSLESSLFELHNGTRQELDAPSRLASSSSFVDGRDTSDNTPHEGEKIQSTFPKAVTAADGDMDSGQISNIAASLYLSLIHQAANDSTITDQKKTKKNHKHKTTLLPTAKQAHDDARSYMADESDSQQPRPNLTAPIIWEQRSAWGGKRGVLVNQTSIEFSSGVLGAMAHFANKSTRVVREIWQHLKKAASSNIRAAPQAY